MPSAVLMSDMKDQVRRGANMETSDQANHFITDAEIYDQLNSENKILYGKLVAARGGSYYRTPVTVATIKGTQSYTVDPAFMQLLEIARLDGEEYIPLERAQNADRQRVWGETQGQPEAYEVAAGSIYLYPTPDNVYTVRTLIVPAYVNLTSGQSFDGINGWEQRSVWAVIAYCAQKDDELGLASFARAKVKELDEQIDALADDRDAAEPMRVQISRPYRWRGA